MYMSILDPNFDIDDKTLSRGVQQQMIADEVLKCVRNDTIAE